MLLNMITNHFKDIAQRAVYARTLTRSDHLIVESYLQTALISSFLSSIACSSSSLLVLMLTRKFFSRA